MADFDVNISDGTSIEVVVTSLSGAGVTDHGALTGLLDDDHSQYHTDVRGDARYSQLGHAHLAAEVAFTAAGGIVATNVQNALQELDTEAEKLANKDQNNGYAGLNSSGRVPIARLASGTPDGTKFVRDDGVLAVPSGGGSGYRTLVTLGSDVANTTSAGFSDITGLSFSVVADTVYRFEALIRFTVNATTIGAGWAVNGPSLTGGGYVVYHTVTASTTSAAVEKFADSYDFGGISTSSASSAGGNIATIEGIVMPKASGTFIMRFVVEAGGTLTAKAGSTLEYW